jgi:hypothetical protein
MDDLQDGICWGTELYQVTWNEDETNFVEWKVIKSDQKNYQPVPNRWVGFWDLDLKAQHTTNSESITFEAKYDEKPITWNEANSSVYESNHCIELDQIRSSYAYSDLNTAKYKNVVSKIGEQGARGSRLNIEEVASLFDELEFEIKIAGFRVEPRFISIFDDFLKKWGESEFIQIYDRKSLQDFGVEFFNNGRYPQRVAVKLKFSIDAASVLKGNIFFEDRHYDWSDW